MFLNYLLKLNKFNSFTSNIYKDEKEIIIKPFKNYYFLNNKYKKEILLKPLEKKIKDEDNNVLQKVILEDEICIKDNNNVLLEDEICFEDNNNVLLEDEIDYIENNNDDDDYEIIN